MRFATAAFALVAASLAAAQSTTTSSSASSTGTSCQAQNIVDACVSQYQSQVNACKGNDWVCLCDTYTNLLTCYNNCPDSNEKPPVQNQVTQFCNAAAPLKSSSLASASSVAKTAVSTATSTGEATTTGTGSASSTKATASGFSTGAAIAVNAPIGGAFAALLALGNLL